MSFISDLVGQAIAPRVSAELQPHLRGLFGGVVRGYLPQTWWFHTETGSATLFVDQQGVAQVKDGRVGQPDAEIAWTDAAFHAAITSRSRDAIPRGTPEPQVHLYTDKGRAAFGQLRRRLGL